MGKKKAWFLTRENFILSYKLTTLFDGLIKKALFEVESMSCQICSNDASARDKIFFPFPLDPTMRLVWFEKIAQPPTWSKVYCCSDHFDNSCFKLVNNNGTHTIALKMRSVPSLKLNKPQNVINWISSTSGTEPQQSPYNIIGNVINVVTHPVPCVQEKVQNENVVEDIPKLRVRKDLMDPLLSSISRESVIRQRIVPESINEEKKTGTNSLNLKDSDVKIVKTILPKESSSLQNVTITLSSSDDESVSTNLVKEKTQKSTGSLEISVKPQDDHNYSHPVNVKPSLKVVNDPEPKISAESLNKNIKTTEIASQNEKPSSDISLVKKLSKNLMTKLSPSNVCKPSTSKSADSKAPLCTEKSDESSHKNKSAPGKPKRRKSFSGRLSSCEEDITQNEFEEKVNLVQKNYSLLIHVLLKTKELVTKKNEISSSEKMGIERSIIKLLAKYKVMKDDIKMVTYALDLFEVVPELERKLKDIVLNAEKLKVAGQNENSAPKRKLCCVPRCQSDSNKFPIKVFFPVPSEAQKRVLWLAAIKIYSSSLEKKFICEDHFTIEDIENYVNCSDRSFLPKLDLKPEKKTMSETEVHKLQIFALKWHSNLKNLITDRNRLEILLEKRFEQLEKRTRPISELWIKAHDKNKAKMASLQKKIENMTFLSKKEIQAGVEIENLITKTERLLQKLKSTEKTEKTTDSTKAYKKIRECFVKSCPNSDISTPFKIFIIVPKEVESRATWFKRAGIEEKKFSKDTFYCCEDHFAMKDLQTLCKNNENSKQNIFPAFFLPTVKIQTNSLNKPALKCLVPTCQNTSIQDKIFFIVPTKPELRKKWFQSIGYTPTQSSGLHVCEDHFDETDFVIKQDGKCLKPTSIPEVKKDIDKLKTEIYSHINFLRFLTLLTTKSRSAVEGLKCKSIEHIKTINNVLITFENVDEICEDVERNFFEIENSNPGDLDLFTVSDDHINQLEIDTKFKDLLIWAKKNGVYVISDSEEDDVQNELSKDSNSVKSKSEKSEISDCFVISDDSDNDDVTPTEEATEKKEVVILSDDEMDEDLISNTIQTEDLEESEIKITNVVECNSLQAFDEQFEYEENEVYDCKIDVGNVPEKIEENEKPKEQIKDNEKVKENINQKKPEKKKVSALDIELSDLEDEYYEEPELLLCNTTLVNSSKLCDVCQDKNGSDLCPKCVPGQFTETMLIINEFGENPKFCEDCGDEIESECSKCVSKKKKKKATKSPSGNIKKRLRLNHECPICFEAFRTKKNLESHLNNCS